MSKTIGGLIGFALGRTLLHEWAVKAIQKSARWSYVFEQIGDDGLRFAFLLRLSPVPSWVNNYGLALTRVSYAQFLVATVFGSLPFIGNNVYMGSLVHNIAHIATAGSGGVAADGGDDEINYVKTALMTMGGVSMLVISRQLVKYLTTQLPETMKSKKA